MPARRNRRLSGASALADASSDEEEPKEEVPKPKPKGRRRLSSGAALMASDSDEEEAKPKKKTNRRRSGVASRRSFGKAALARTAAVDMSADEVAAMYSKTIKMATEGKINAKNAWNLPLIDHMRDVVKGEDSTDKKRPQRAVNFQKASCTIEAGMKIYCSRVDDTLTTSYRVLESLHRGKDENNGTRKTTSRTRTTTNRRRRRRRERRRRSAGATPRLH